MKSREKMMDSRKRGREIKQLYSKLAFATNRHSRALHQATNLKMLPCCSLSPTRPPLSL